MKQKRRKRKYKEEIKIALETVVTANHQCAKRSNAMDKTTLTIRVLEEEITNLQCQNYELTVEIDEHKGKNLRLFRDINYINKIMNENHDEKQ